MLFRSLNLSWGVIEVQSSQMLLSRPWIFHIVSSRSKGAPIHSAPWCGRLLCIPGGLGLDQWIMYGRGDMPTFGAPSPCSAFLILSLELCHQADLAAIAIPTAPSFLTPSSKPRMSLVVKAIRAKLVFHEARGWLVGPIIMWQSLVKNWAKGIYCGMRHQGVEQFRSCLDQDLYDTEDGQVWGSWEFRTWMTIIWQVLGAENTFWEFGTWVTDKDKFRDCSCILLILLKHSGLVL